MVSRNLILGMLGLGLAACGSDPSPNWVAVEMSDTPGQFYIDVASTKTLDSGNKVANIYIETPDNPDTSRAEASLELNCANDTLRVTKSIMVRRASGIRVDLTGYPTSDNWVNPNQVGFSDVYNYVCRNHGATPPTSINASTAVEPSPEATESDVAAAAGTDNFEDLNRNALSVGRRCFVSGDEPACTEFDKIFSDLSTYEQKGIPFCNLEVTRYVSYSVPCSYKQEYFDVFIGM
jgi:hypothetical protein